MYLVVGVESGIAWPMSDTTIQYDGIELLLRPGTADLLPTIVLEYEGGPEAAREALSFLRRFLSALSWTEQGPLREKLVSGGGAPIRLGRGPSSNLVTPEFRADFLPTPRNTEQRLALAFYRQALNVEDIPYRFLSYFKILNIRNPRGDDQVSWINSHLNAIEDHYALARLAELQHEEIDVGDYLYRSGRCAIAHAYTAPLVDPEDADDLRRLSTDMPLIKSLAELFIERELGISTRRTIFREHLYELSGFKAILSQELIERIRAGGRIAVLDVINVPPLILKIRDKPLCPSFEHLVPERVTSINGRLFLGCRSAWGGMFVRIVLNFASERLELDPIQDVSITDDGTVEPLECLVDQMQMAEHLLLNGQLEIWSPLNDELLGRTDPCIPVNIDVRATLQNFEEKRRIIAEEMEKRRGTSEARTAPGRS